MVTWHVAWDASGDPSNCVVRHVHTVCGILVVDSRMVVVLEPLLIDVTVNHWSTEIDEEECWNRREDKSNPVTRQHLVDHTVSLPRWEGIPKPVVRGVGECGLLLDEACNVKVDTSAKLWLHFETLDHLDELELFVLHGRVLWPDFPQVLVDVVVKGLHN